MSRIGAIFCTVLTSKTAIPPTITHFLTAVAMSMSEASWHVTHSRGCVPSEGASDPCSKSRKRRHVYGSTHGKEKQEQLKESRAHANDAEISFPAVTKASAKQGPFCSNPNPEARRRNGSPPNSHHWRWRSLQLEQTVEQGNKMPHLVDIGLKPPYSGGVQEESLHYSTRWCGLDSRPVTQSPFTTS